MDGTKRNSKSDPLNVDTSEFKALTPTSAPGETQRIHPDLLELAKTYYLMGNSLSQISRLTGMKPSTLDYHIYNKKNNPWREVKDRLDRLRTQAIATTINKVSNDYAETLLISAERLLNSVRNSDVILSIQEQKALTDAISTTFKNQLEREKLNLAIATAQGRMPQDNELLTEGEAELIIAEDPAAQSGTLKEESKNYLVQSQPKADNADTAPHGATHTQPGGDIPGDDTGGDGPASGPLSADDDGTLPGPSTDDDTDA